MSEVIYVIARDLDAVGKRIETVREHTYLIQLVMEDASEVHITSTNSELMMMSDLCHQSWTGSVYYGHDFSYYQTKDPAYIVGARGQLRLWTSVGDGHHRSADIMMDVYPFADSLRDHEPGTIPWSPTVILQWYTAAAAARNLSDHLESIESLPF
jgi:hypothetical protein